MLHLRARHVGNMFGTRFFYHAQSFASHQSSQRRIPDVDSVFLGQYLVHPLHIPAAMAMKLREQLFVNITPVTTDFGLSHAISVQYRPHGLHVKMQQIPYGSALRSLPVQRQNRGLLVLFDYPHTAP